MMGGFNNKFSSQMPFGKSSIRDINNDQMLGMSRNMPDVMPFSLVPGDLGAFGYRQDGSPKGAGWLGFLKRPDNRYSTELSVDLQINGKNELIPLLVPGLSEYEINYLLSTPEREVFKNKEIIQPILEKAAAHAAGRIKNGFSPFKD